MGVLEQVIQLKNQGYGDQDIVAGLQEQGVSPKEITDAINQANIKNAVSSGEGMPMPAYEAAPVAMAGENLYTPQTQEAGAGYARQPAQQYYEEGSYAQQPSGGIDSDTIIEISNQVFSEKTKKIQNQIDDIAELKSIIQVKVDGIDERLKRIEKIIDNLQIKIIEKVGTYGRELETTKKEVAMVEETLGKVIKTKHPEHHALLKKIRPKKKTSKKK